MREDKIVNVRKRVKSECKKIKEDKKWMQASEQNLNDKIGQKMEKGECKKRKRVESKWQKMRGDEKIVLGNE